MSLVLPRHVLDGRQLGRDGFFQLSYLGFYCRFILRQLGNNGVFFVEFLLVLIAELSLEFDEFFQFVQ